MDGGEMWALSPLNVLLAQMGVVTADACVSENRFIAS